MHLVEDEIKQKKALIYWKKIGHQKMYKESLREKRRK